MRCQDTLPRGGFVSRRRLLGATLLLEGAILVLALGLRAWLDLDRDAPVDFGMPALRWGVAATLAPLAFLWWSARTGWGPVHRLHDRVLQLVRTLFAHATVIDVAVVSTLAGVGEELLFRGVLQALLTRLAGFWVGWIVASVVFGLAHMITPMYVVVVIGIGLYLGALLQGFDNLAVPIVVHALYDFVALVYLMRRALPARPSTDEKSLN
jgi:membrane protease YdiL (CAAX protease family)